MRIFFTLLAIATYISLFGENVYRDFLTGFDGFSKYADSQSGCIVINNPNDSKIIETSKFDTKEKEFTYTIRLKSSGRKSGNRFLNSLQQHSYGIIWNYKDNDNYKGIEITPTNSSYYDDITNQQSLKVEIFRMQRLHSHRRVDDTGIVDVRPSCHISLASPGHPHICHPPEGVCRAL